MRKIIILGFTGCLYAAPLQAQSVGDWYLYTQASASVLNAATGTNSQVNSVCNGTASACTAAGGYYGLNSVAETSSLVTASASGVYPSYATTLNPTGSSAASALSRVDLASGQIGIATSAAGVGGEHTGAGAQASLYDSLLFNLVGATAPVPITVSVHVDGSFQGDVQPRFAFSLSDGVNVLTTGTVAWLATSSSGVTSTSDTQALTMDRALGNWTSFGPEEFVGTFLVDPNDPLLHIGMDLRAGGPADSSASFQHTAAVNFILPTGVTFTSASGSFLTAANSTGAVPEPATWAMMLLGFGGIGFTMRRRNKLLARPTSPEAA